MAKFEDIKDIEPHNCVDCGKPIRFNAKYRCRECWLKTNQGRPHSSRSEPYAPVERDVILWHDQDERFCLAMIRAVEAGLERPPGMRICKTPGTQRPIFLDTPRDIPIRSACAWMTEAAGSGDN